MEAERVAEPEGGPASTFLAEQAAAHDIWLYASVAELPRAGGLPRNVGVLCAPDGRQHRYAKIHPFTYAREHEIYDAGTEMVTVDVEGLRVSLFVCYDLRFADEFWALAAQTDLYVVPANWPQPRHEHWRALLRARAIENQAYVLGVNRVGAVQDLVHVGGSALIDPLGQTVVEGDADEAVLVADVDAAVVAETRTKFPFLADRR
jgi:predicted amidohydrolase